MDRGPAMDKPNKFLYVYKNETRGSTWTDGSFSQDG
jgi:hypothetical protein